MKRRDFFKLFASTCAAAMIPFAWLRPKKAAKIEGRAWARLKDWPITVVGPPFEGGTVAAVKPVKYGDDDPHQHQRPHPFGGDWINVTVDLRSGESVEVQAAPDHFVPMISVGERVVVEVIRT